MMSDKSKCESLQIQLVGLYLHSELAFAISGGSVPENLFLYKNSPLMVRNFPIAVGSCPVS